MAAAAAFAAAAQSPAGLKPKKGGNPEAATIKNPVAATPESIAAGKRAYQRLCIKCHGPEGKGDGTAATGAQPSDLTGAKIDGADLQGANLHGAKLAGLDLAKARNVTAGQTTLAGPKRPEE